jgi:AcrR family transcriptional regulator
MRMTRSRSTVTCVAEGARTARAEQTRAAITEAALALFRDRGYEAATMRAIAQRAGVSTGNAYYYFSSKEELIQEFYSRNHAAHLAASAGVLAAETDLAARLGGTVRALIDVLMPYHSFAATFYKHAAEPASPLSPFSPQSSPARQASIAIYRNVVAGSSARMGPGLRERLPELLWLYSLGMTLYWVHDNSDSCAKTYQLIDATVPVIAQLVAASRLPVLRRTLTDLIAIADRLAL